MRKRLQRLQRRRIVSVVIIIAVLILAVRVALNQFDPSLTLAGPSLVPNSDFAVDADNDKLPDGWITAGVGGIERGTFTVDGNGYGVFINGVNNWLKTPYVAVQPGNSYRVAFQALADDQSKRSPTQVEAWFHWRDERGTEFSIEYGAAQTVPFGTWAETRVAKTAPDRALQLAISIHPLTDDRIVVDAFSVSQVGVAVAPWPHGKQAAVAFSFDYETAMGGLVHSRSVDDPQTGDDPIVRAGRMRAGATWLQGLFARNNVRATFYTNGYNLLTGNRAQQRWLADPTFAWADRAHGWPSDYWATTPWFAPDPFADETSAPAWYFGSQTAELAAAGHRIESHTFAHLHGAFSEPAVWQSDFDAWNAAAQAMQLPPATSLAFPWSSSAGMSLAQWQVVARNGVRSLTRTNWRQERFALADRTTYAIRPLASTPLIAVVGDEYVRPQELVRLQQRLGTALANGGVIDLWAHTEEAVTPAQQRTWQALVDAAQSAAWISTVPDIVAYHAAVRQVRVVVQAEAPQYRFSVTNPTATPLAGLTLVLPVAATSATVNRQSIPVQDQRLSFDLAAQSTAQIVVMLPASS